VLKTSDVLGLGPLAGGGLADLHEADLARLAARLRIKPAFAPDNGFHQRSVHCITCSGGTDDRVLTVLSLPAIIQPAADGIHDKDKRDEREPLAPWGAAGSFIARHAREW